MHIQRERVPVPSNGPIRPRPPVVPERLGHSPDQRSGRSMSHATDHKHSRVHPLAGLRSRRHKGRQRHAQVGLAGLFGRLRPSGPIRARRAAAEVPHQA